MKPSYYSDYERNLLARYEILLQHKMHVDGVSWSRIQTLHLIQAGVIGGSFFIYQTNLPRYFVLGLLGLGFVLTVLLLILCIYDRQSALANEDKLYKLGNTLNIRWAPNRWKIGHYEITAHRIRILVICLFILVDLVLFLYFLFDSKIATYLVTGTTVKIPRQLF